MTMALPDLGLELGLGLGFGLRFSGGSLGECRVRIGAGRAGAGVAVEVRKAREGGVAMDAAEAFFCIYWNELEVFYL